MRILFKQSSIRW